MSLKELLIEKNRERSIGDDVTISGYGVAYKSSGSYLLSEKSKKYLGKITEILNKSMAS